MILEIFNTNPVNVAPEKEVLIFFNAPLSTRTGPPPSRRRGINHHFYHVIFPYKIFQGCIFSHMLDVISVSENFYKYVRNCGISKTGMKSDHSAVRLQFVNRSIKLKTTLLKKTVIDWKSVKEKEEVNKKFNVNLRNCLKTTSNYTDFNNAILQSREETAMKKSNEDQGWYHFSRDTLTPTLEARNSVLHAIRAENNTPSSRTLHHLKTLQ